MKNFKPAIGELSKTYEDVFSEERLLEFARVVGVEGDAFTDSSSIPTLFTIFRHGEFELMDRLGITLKEVLHGEQEYDYSQPIRANERVSFQTSLADVHEKKGKGALLHFLIFKTEVLRAEDGQLLAQAKSSVVVRELGVV